MEHTELTITRDGIEAVAHYTGRSVEVDLYRDGALLNHISSVAEWQHYETTEAMLTTTANAAIDGELAPEGPQ